VTNTRVSLNYSQFNDRTQKVMKSLVLEL
jgi:hypothetical protein